MQRINCSLRHSSLEGRLTNCALITETGIQNVVAQPVEYVIL